MTTRLGISGLLLTLALVPSACGGDDDDTGAAGTGNVPAAGSAGRAGAGSSAGGAANGGEPALGGEGGGTSQQLEISGTWENSTFGETDVIDDTSWSTDYGDGASVGTIGKWSNDDNVLYRKAPADATFNPLKYDVIAWTEIEGDHFYYCTVAFGLDTLSEAEADTTPYDASDPEHGGCGGFSWTKLTRK